MRSVSRALGAWTLPTTSASPPRTPRSKTAESPTKTCERVDDLGRRLVEYAGVERYPDVAEPADPPLPCD